MGIDGRKVTLAIDKAAKTVRLKVDDVVVVMTLGEWSRLIVNPDVVDTVIAGVA